MPFLCSASNCDSRSDKGIKLSFHKFPDKEKNPDVYAAWLSICPIDFQCGKSSRICSKHFANCSYFYTPTKTKRKVPFNGIPDGTTLLSSRIRFTAVQKIDNSLVEQQPSCSQTPVHLPHDPTMLLDVSFLSPLGDYFDFQRNHRGLVAPLKPKKSTNCFNPKKKWTQLHFDCIEKNFKCDSHMNPIIDDEMTDEDVAAVFQYAHEVHGITTIENGKISRVHTNLFIDDTYNFH
jgi:hypothetical protein